MKFYSNLQKILHATPIWAILLFSTTLVSAQVVNTDLRATVYNGKIAIQVKDALSTNSYFAVSMAGTVDLSFYFGPEDPRNGNYSTGILAQPNGQVYLRFEDIPYQMGDTLTFSVIETLLSGTTREYVFVRGDYFPEGGTPVTTCPISIICTGQKIKLIYDPQEVVIGVGSTQSIQLFMPGLCHNGNINGGGYDPSQNAIIAINQSQGCGPFDCQKIMSGTVTFIINGITCVFQNGLPIGNCSTWSDYYTGSLECAGYFESCAPEMLDFFQEIKYTIPCLQWIDNNACNTTSQIKRPGKVAIGTSNFAPNAALTVKNGIITDKVKVTNSGWADYVFEKDYPLMPLEELEAYISKYHHLPDTPNGKEVETAGSFELGETTINHQVKIEEIFLHLIKLEQETKMLEAELFLYETLNKIRIKK